MKIEGIKMEDIKIELDANDLATINPDDFKKFFIALQELIKNAANLTNEDEDIF